MTSSGDSTAVCTASLESLIELGDCPFELGALPPELDWDQVDTSPSLLYEHARFPRQFRYSNDVLSNILEPALRRTCEHMDRHESAREAFSSRFLEYILRRRVNSKWKIFDLLNTTSHMYDHYFSPINNMVRGNWVGREPGSTALATWRAAGLGKEGMSDWELGITQPASESARGGFRVAKAILALTHDSAAPIDVFDGIVEATKRGVLSVDENGRAAMADGAYKEGLQAGVATAIERWCSHVWCHMIHRRVRFAVLTSVISTLVFYLNEGAIQVTDRIPMSSATVGRPCHSLLGVLFSLSVLDHAQYLVPAEYTGPAPERRRLPIMWKWQPSTETSLSLTYKPLEGAFPEMSRDMRWSRVGLVHTKLPENSVVAVHTGLQQEELGPPSLFVRLGPAWKDFRHLRVKAVSHSLGKARRLPDLFHGPIDPRSLPSTGLPLLIGESTPAPVVQASTASRDETRPPTTPLPLSNGEEASVIRPQIIQLDDSVSYGAVWDVFRVSFPEGGNPYEFPLVAKVICTDAFSTALDPKAWAVPYGRDGVSRSEARLQAKKEMVILQDLSSIMPDCVARVIGIWGSLQNGGKEVWVTVMEDVGAAVNVADMSKPEKNLVLEQYRRLHEAGYLHDDVETRHWRRGCLDPNAAASPQPVRLIDFDRSLRRADMSVDEWKDRTAFEMLKVRGYLRLRPRIRSRYRTLVEVKQKAEKDLTCLRSYGLLPRAVRGLSHGTTKHAEPSTISKGSLDENSPGIAWETWSEILRDEEANSP